MKKILTLLVTAALAVPSLWAQDPEAIYVATCSATTQYITPSDEDTKLEYNSSSQCYEGVIKDWQKGSYNDLKKLYSIDNDVMTIYGNSGSTMTQMMITDDPVVYTLATKTVNKETGSDQYKVSATYGFWLSSSFADQLNNIKVEVNLDQNTITFSISDESSEVVIPTLENVNPKNGSAITPSDDGSATITLTFTGEVTSMEVICGDDELTPTSNEDGTIWTIKVTDSQIASNVSDGNGLLNLKIQKVKADKYDVTFDNQQLLQLSFPVAGISPEVTLNFTGNEEALKTLTLYQNNATITTDEAGNTDVLQYIEGLDNVVVKDNSFTGYYGNEAHFLFTVEGNYDFVVKTNLTEENNWSLGTGYSEKKIVDEDNEDGDISYEKLLDGTVLNVNTNCKGTTFTIYVVPKAPEAIYMSGSFNDDETDDEAYKFTPDEDNSTLFYKLVEIEAADQVSFNFVYGNTYIVPSKDANVSVEFDNSEYAGNYTFTGNFVTSSTAASNWLIDNWAGGELEVFINWEDQTISLQYEVELEEAWYLRGAFNNYTPSADWKLSPVGGDGDEEEVEENGVYEGTFNVPAGELSFNFLAPNGWVYIPQTIATDNFTFEFGEYKGALDYSNGGDEDNIYWVNENWKGGEVYIQIDLNTSSVIVKDLSYVAPQIYISGVFNEYNPVGNQEWLLAQGDIEDGEGYLYTGYFDIDEGLFDFYFVNGETYLVPAEGTVVEFTEDENGTGYYSFTGNFVESGTASASWEFNDWAGGELGVQINLDDKTVTFTYLPAPTETWYILSEENDYEPNEYFVLVPSPYDDEEGIYLGVVDITAGKFSFNLQNPYGNIYVPAIDQDPADVKVEFTEGKVDGVETYLFEGGITMAYEPEEESYYWSYDEWDGGMVNIILDMNEGKITIFTDNETVSVSSIDKVAKDSDAIYNLQGVKVDRNKVNKGIYIINGKKVLVK